MTETQRFDREAATWDENPRRVRLAKAVADAIAGAVPLSSAWDVLDYGCGTGLLTLNLRPKVRRIVGADTSPGMLEVLQRKILEQDLDNVETLLLRPDDPCGLHGPFDLVASSMTLHHVEDPAALVRDFADHLKAGGRIALADLDPEDGSFHENAQDVFHQGFDRDWIKALLRGTGFVDLRDATAFEVRRNGRDYPVFLVVGRRAG